MMRKARKGLHERGKRGEWIVRNGDVTQAGMVSGRAGCVVRFVFCDVRRGKT